MAGQPEFIRAKRLWFMHSAAKVVSSGSLEIAPTTSLILHPTTDLVASPEGTFHIKTDVDMNNKKLTKVQGGNVLSRRKITVTHADFTAASLDQRVTLFEAAAGDTVYDIIGQLATPFKYDTGPATVLGSICKMSIGDNSYLTGFSTAQLVGSSVAPAIMFASPTGLGGKGLHLWNASGVRVQKVYTAAASIECKLNASAGFFVASLTQGAIHFYVDYISIDN